MLVVECIFSDVDLRIGERSERRMSCSKDMLYNMYHFSTTVPLHPSGQQESCQWPALLLS